MKFKYKNLRIGDVVTVEDYTGLQFRMRVASFELDGSVYPILLDRDGLLPPESFSFDGISPFPGQLPDQMRFSMAGFWTYGDGQSARIVSIERPWRKLKAPTQLDIGMEVQIKAAGEWIKGRVSGKVPYDLHGERAFNVVFMENVPMCGGGHWRAGQALTYFADGMIEWARSTQWDKNVSTLRIRKFR